MRKPRRFSRRRIANHQHSYCKMRPSTVQLIVYFSLFVASIWSLVKLQIASLSAIIGDYSDNFETVSILSSSGKSDNNNSSDKKGVPLAIVTAFSRGHTLEEVAMLQSLVYVEFDGPIYVYLMREVNGHNISWSDEFKLELSKSPLQLTMIDVEIPEYYWSYCFKPRIMGDFLYHFENKINPQTVMWADSSTRFMEDPTTWAQRMIKDDVDFVGRTSGWNVPEQTHNKTFEYYNLTREEFRHNMSIAATHFIVNLAKEKQQQQQQNQVGGTFVDNVLRGWIDCGTRACQTCMAPIGSKKWELNPKGSIHVDGSVQYLSHRQDQAVLGLLLYNYTHWKNDPSVNIQLVDYPAKARSQYWWVVTMRDRNGPFGGANTVADWRPNRKKEEE